MRFPTRRLSISLFHTLSKQGGEPFDVLLGEARVALSSLEGCRPRKRWYPLARRPQKGRHGHESEDKVGDHDVLSFGSAALEGTELLPGEEHVGNVQLKLQLAYNDTLMVHTENGGGQDDKHALAVIGAGGDVRFQSASMCPSESTSGYNWVHNHTQPFTI